MSSPVLTFAPNERGDIPVDLDRLVGSRMLLQAGSGGGKSYALRYILEQTHGRIQQIVIDPEGEFASLREKYDYLLASKEGDVPAQPRSAKLLCRRIVELGVSAVVDIYDLELPERRRFVKLFLEQLVNLPRSLWRPLIVVLDEAHLFAPEQSQSEALSAVINLCTLGRKRGFCPILATQRISKLHKDAAAELHNKLIGLTGLDVDIKRAGDELGFDKEQRSTLRELPAGHFYAFGPAIGAPGVTLVRTGDVRTTHPRPGEVAPPAPPAPAAIAALARQLQDLPAQAEEEARSVEDLQRQVVKLESELRRARKTTEPDPSVIRRAVDEATIPLVNRVAAFEHKVSRVSVLIDEAAAVLRNGSSPVPPLPVPPSHPRSENRKISAPTSPAPAPVAAVAPNPVARPERAAGPATGASTLPGQQQRILDAIAALEDRGVKNPPKAAVAAWAGQATTPAGFEKNLSQLSKAGLVERIEGGRLSTTDEGDRLAAKTVEIVTLADLHLSWRDALPEPRWRILTILIDRYPQIMGAAELAESSGQAATPAGFEKNLSGLSALGLVQRLPGRAVKATELLFPEGLHG